MRKTLSMTGYPEAHGRVVGYCDLGPARRSEGCSRLSRLPATLHDLPANRKWRLFGSSERGVRAQNTPGREGASQQGGTGVLRASGLALVACLAIDLNRGEGS